MRATLGTPGRDQRQHAGDDGDPRVGTGSVCLPVRPPYRGVGGPQPLAPARYSDAQLRRSPGPARFKSKAQLQEPRALNSGASPLIVQTQFLYESAANRELWLDICG